MFYIFRVMIMLSISKYIKKTAKKYTYKIYKNGDIVDEDTNTLKKKFQIVSISKMFGYVAIKILKKSKKNKIKRSIE